MEKAMEFCVKRLGIGGLCFLCTGDLLQRLLPIPVFGDQAAALEESWEAGFARIYPNAECGLDKSLSSSFKPDARGKQQWSPRPLVNSPYEESGRQLLTTSFKAGPTILLDTHDFHQLNDQAAIRASTAALNWARFSYVSPSGTFGKKVDGSFVPTGFSSG